MVPVKSILAAIDVNFMHMESHLEKAKMSMGIKPDLAAALKHANEVSLAIHALAQLDTQARMLHGFALPLDMIHKVNARQVELLHLADEIAACKQAVSHGELRDATRTGGKALKNTLN